MPFFSIRWKLALSLIGLSLGLVGSYIYLAKRTFESDKISYVFEANQNQLFAIKKNFENEIAQAFFTAKALSGTLDPGTKNLSPAGRALFQAQQSVQALQISNLPDKQIFLKYPESYDFLTPPATATSDMNIPIQLHRFPGKLFRLTSNLKADDGSATEMTTIVKSGTLFPKTAGSFFVLQDSEGVFDQQDVQEMVQGSELDETLKELYRDRTDRTFLRTLNGQEFLVSTTFSNRGDFQFISFTDKKFALGALNVLYKRSLFFIFFSIFVTLIIALSLSGGLTQSLNQITEMAIHLGKGNFSGFSVIKSRDEVGILSRTFVKMSSEIERLISETRVKARMEEELKTASLVQESLLPANASFQLNKIQIAGSLKNSTECGGDWWFYFHQGDNLYLAIADATGHGTPAALITSAARAAFSIISESQMSLEEMMKMWDNVVASCSANRVYMTALLLQIDTMTGKGSVINASHEWPFHFSADAGLSQNHTLSLHPGGSLGERSPTPRDRTHFQLNPGDRILLYTDGLFAIQNKAGQVFNERRFLRLLKESVGPEMDALEFLKTCEKIAADYNDDQALPDDITLVSIKAIEV